MNLRELLNKLLDLRFNSTNAYVNAETIPVHIRDKSGVHYAIKSVETSAFGSCVTITPVDFEEYDYDEVQK